MEAQVVNARPSVASHDETVRCLLAIELSKKSWIVAVNTPLSDKISRYTLEACNWRELLDLCERIRTRVARETKKRVEIISCYEAGYDGFWLHRLLEAHGIRNYVIDPASLQVDRRPAIPGRSAISVRQRNKFLPQRVYYRLVSAGRFSKTCPKQCKHQRRGMIDLARIFEGEVSICNGGFRIAKHP